MHRRASYLVALLVSVLLHAGLVLLYFFGPPPPARPSAAPQPPPVEWITVDLDPAPPSPAIEEQAPTPAPAAKKRAHKKAPAPSPEAPIISDAPRAEPAEPEAWAPLQNDSPVIERGRTITPDDPSLTPHARRAEEGRRVKRRVEGFLQDGLAEARAQSGVPHPYFAHARDGASTQLRLMAKEAGVLPTAAQALAVIGSTYRDSASSYGKTGDPELGASASASRRPDPIGARPNDQQTAAMKQGTETQLALEKNKPLITLTLEVRQFKDGSPLSAVVLRASGDPQFDSFVVKTWTAALMDRAPPPPDAFHGAELRSQWRVEGWLGLPKSLQTAISYLPMPNDMLLGALTKEGYHYEFRTKLLRVYH